MKDTHCELSHTSLECNIRGSGVKAAMSKDEDRAKGDSDTQGAKSDSVKRQLTGEDAPEEANPESLVGPTGGKKGQEPPAGVGESVARRGEDMIEHHGKEAGRHDTGTDDSEAERPTGESTERDRGGIDPQEGPA